MKNKILILVAMAGAMFFTACEDFLTSTNTTNANQETYFESDEALATATAPLYNYVWHSFNDKLYYSMGDGRSNNLTARWSDYIYPFTNFTETALSPGLEEAWGSLYSVIAQANYTITNIQNYSSSAVTEAAKIQAYAEARFMRGVAYWYIGSLWGKGIIYTDTAAQVADPVVPPHRQTDVIEFAIRDLEYAAANLSETASNPGRVTKHSAYGMLSRVYLSMAGLTTSGAYDGTNIETNFNDGVRNEYYLDLAKKAALKCIEGPYALLPEYKQLFAVETWNNNSESVFQLQWLKGGTDAIGWGANNGLAHKDGKILKINYPSCDLEVLFETGISGENTARFYPDSIAVIDRRSTTSEEPDVIHFYRYNGKHLGEVILDIPNNFGGAILIGESRDRIYLGSNIMFRGLPNYYIDKSEFGTGNIELHEMQHPDLTEQERIALFSAGISE